MFSWIWSKLSGRAAPNSFDAWKRNVRAVLALETNWRLVRESIDRLDRAGLPIAPSLDRDLMIVRFLRRFAGWGKGDDLAAFFAEAKSPVAHNALDLLVFECLASETYEFDEIDAVLPKLSGLSDDDRKSLIEAHSCSMFDNAYTMCIVNEHAPGEFLPQHVRELEALAGGDFAVQLVSETEKQERLFGEVMLADGHTASFETGDEKRPDLTPFFEAMSALVAPLNKGRFVVASFGNSEDLVVLYLHPHEQIAFRDWAGEQRFANGTTLLENTDWF